MLELHTPSFLTNGKREKIRFCRQDESYHGLTLDAVKNSLRILMMLTLVFFDKHRVDCGH